MNEEYSDGLPAQTQEDLAGEARTRSSTEVPSGAPPADATLAPRPAQGFWRNSWGAVRTPWRLAIWIGLAFIATVVAASLQRSLNLHNGESEATTGAAFLILVAFIILASLIPIKVFDRAPGSGMARLGLAIDRYTARDWALGFAVGGGLIVALWLIEGAIDALTFGPDVVFDGVALLAAAMMFFFAALFEELIFRGYPLRVLAEATGRWPAIALTSLAFGWAHNGNPEASLLSFTNTTLAGVLLALAWWRTESLWLPTVLHWAWNLMMGPVLGLPVSGLPFPARLLDSDLTARGLELSLWTGGEYGPEGGLLLTMLVIPACILLARTGLSGRGRNVEVARLQQQAGGGAQLAPGRSAEPTPTPPLDTMR